MKNLILLLNETGINFKIEIGDLNVNHIYTGRNEITGVLFCKPNHFQPLLNLGVRINFSNKRVGMAYNQNHVGGSGNTCAVNVRMSAEVLEVLSAFVRKDYFLNLLNDQQLAWANFPFTPAKIKTKNVLTFKKDSIVKIEKLIRMKANSRGYSKEVYNMPVVQKAIGNYKCCSNQ